MIPLDRGRQRHFLYPLSSYGASNPLYYLLYYYNWTERQREYNSVRIRLYKLCTVHNSITP